MPNITVTASTHPQYKDITLISAKGFIDTTTAPEFEKTFQKVLGENRFNLIIDLKDVSYISSAGWGIFIGELKRIRGQRGNLFLVAMGPEVTDAFELLEFNTILKSFATVEQAVQKGFGKTLANMVGDTQKKGRVPAKAKGEKIFAGPPSEMVAGEPKTTITLKKSSRFSDIFKPWKWFSS
jgi:anti-sigma B factor antagonist